MMIIIFGLISLLIISTLILEKKSMKLQRKLYSFLTVFFTLLLTISWAEDPVTWSVKSNKLGNQEYEVTYYSQSRKDGIYILNF